MDEDLKKRQKDMYQGLWFGTVVLAIILITFWIFPERVGADFWDKIEWTAIIIAAVTLGWIFFYRQKKIDEGKLSQKEGAKKDFFEGSNVYHGLRFKYYSIGSAIGMVVLIIFGIYTLINELMVGGSLWWAGLLMIVIGGLLVIPVKTYWEYGKHKMKGRYY